MKTTREEKDEDSTIQLSARAARVVGRKKEVSMRAPASMTAPRDPAAKVRTRRVLSPFRLTAPAKAPIRPLQAALQCAMTTGATAAAKMDLDFEMVAQGAFDNWKGLALRLRRWMRFHETKIAALRRLNLLHPQKQKVKDVEAVERRAAGCLHPLEARRERNNQYCKTEYCKQCGIRLAYESMNPDERKDPIAGLLRRGLPRPIYKATIPKKLANIIATTAAEEMNEPNWDLLNEEAMKEAPPGGHARAPPTPPAPRSGLPVGAKASSGGATREKRPPSGEPKGAERADLEETLKVIMQTQANQAEQVRAITEAMGGVVGQGAQVQKLTEMMNEMVTHLQQGGGGSPPAPLPGLPAGSASAPEELRQ